jgi:hypothetical protein
MLGGVSDVKAFTKHWGGGAGTSLGSVHNSLHKYLNIHFPCQQLVPKKVNF